MAKIAKALILFCLMQSSCFAGPIIDTLSGYTNNSFIGPFGEATNTSTWGQTFVAPNDAQFLNHLSFVVTSNGGPTTGDWAFELFVMEWAGDRAVGPVLYQSEKQILSGSVRTALTFNFATGGVSVQEGTGYIAILSTINSNGTEPTRGNLGYRNADLYSGGQVYRLLSATSTDSFTSNAWNQVGNGRDLAFRAEFSTSAVPEPSSFVLALFGFVGVVILASRRRYRTATNLS